VDKRVLPALAVALDVPLCQLVCGEHNCSERACVPPSRLRRASAKRQQSRIVPGKRGT
jgi:hypothetical protein